MENNEENTTIRPLRNDHFDVDCSRARNFTATVNSELALALIWREVHRSHVLSTRSYCICDQEVFDFLFYESLLFSR